MKDFFSAILSAAAFIIALAALAVGFVAGAIAAGLHIGYRRGWDL